MKTHAIFILENESIIRSGFPPTSLTLHSSTLQTAQLKLLQIGARAPRSRLSVSASLGKVAELDEARREKCPTESPPRRGTEAQRRENAGSRDRRIRKPPAEAPGECPGCCERKEVPSAALRTACEPAARQAKIQGTPEHLYRGAPCHCTGARPGRRTWERPGYHMEPPANRPRAKRRNLGAPEHLHRGAPCHCTAVRPGRRTGERPG